MEHSFFEITITLLGGLAIFIYGMNLMSDGLQKSAGDKMRKVLEMLTSNPILGVISGALVTAVLQSSSATTVMVIGFTSAGLMKLPQAISVILGANIGTTITAQLVAFKVGDYAWIFVFAGFILYFFINKSEKIKDIGQVIFGFGLLFVGINVMGDIMKPLAHSEAFMKMIIQVQDSPVLGVALGVASTALVQSSSAVIAVLQNLASTPASDGTSALISLSGALPILFGSNIGTTITAILAAIGGSIAAKRTAVAHTIFNFFGTLLFIFFIPQLIFAVEKISPSGLEYEIISREIANAHLLFNVINTLIFLPLIWLLVKIVVKCVPGEDKVKLSSEPYFLDEKVINQPVFGIYLAIQELSRVGNLVFDMLIKSKQAYMANDLELANEVIEDDLVINELRHKTIEYLSMLLSTETITDAQRERVSGLFHVAGDIEHIGDYCKNIVKFSKTKDKYKYNFSDIAYAGIYECFDIAQHMMESTLKALEEGDFEKANYVLKKEEELNILESNLRKNHIQRLNNKTCSPAYTMVYTDTIHNLERIGDSCKNIAQIILKTEHLKDTAKKPENEG